MNLAFDLPKIKAQGALTIKQPALLCNPVVLLLRTSLLSGFLYLLNPVCFDLLLIAFMLG